jgi:hypothetical protein
VKNGRNVIPVDEAKSQFHQHLPATLAEQRELLTTATTTVIKLEYIVVSKVLRASFA